MLPPPLVSPLVMPFTTAHFVLVINGLDKSNGLNKPISMNFAKCTGLAGEIGVEEYQEGGENRFAHRLPVRASFPNLVLSQGAGPVTGLWDWFGRFHVEGLVEPRDGIVILQSSVAGVITPVRAWSFTRGWPVKITGSDLDAQSPGVAIDVIEIAHHGLALKEVPLKWP